MPLDQKKADAWEALAERLRFALGSADCEPETRDIGATAVRATDPLAPVIVQLNPAAAWHLGIGNAQGFRHSNLALEPL